MKYKQLVRILIFINILLFLFFIIFISFINIVKILDYSFKVEKVIKLANENKKIVTVKSDLNKIKNNKNLKKYDVNKAHTADLLGYKNSLYTINGTEWGDGINIMLVGSDNKSNNHDKSRADVIIVLRIISSGKILSISIPRDTLITINDGKWKGYPDKIGHTFYWGGMNNLKNSVEELLGSPIYRVAVIDNFNSFEAYLAIIGGLNIDKKLEGKLGVQWIRNRSFEAADIERCRRHQIFLKKSVIKLWEMTKQGKYFYTKLFYNSIIKVLKTDLTEKEFLNIIYILKKNRFDPETDFYVSVLPGEYSKYDSYLLQRNELHCWRLDDKIISNLQFLLYSEEKSYKNFIKRNNSFMDFALLSLNQRLKKNKTMKSLNR